MFRGRATDVKRLSKASRAGITGSQREHRGPPAALRPSGPLVFQVPPVRNEFVDNATVLLGSTVRLEEEVDHAHAAR
jgi:hypothetical protein